MRIVEIFGSVDGEGIFAGSLATFVRVAGCNLSCRYCDTPYAMSRFAGTDMDMPSITAEVDKLGYHHVTITGGEPAWHCDTLPLTDALLSKGYHVNLETNGTQDIAPFLKNGVTVTMDYKTPYSGHEKDMLLGNLSLLRPSDVLKFVIAPEDLECVERVISQNNIKAWIYLSPVFGLMQPAALVEFSKKLFLKHGQNAAKVRVQVQLHKIIWSPAQRGV